MGDREPKDQTKGPSPTDPKEDPNLIKFDPVTAVAIIAALLLLPLLLTGFIAQ